MRPLTPEALLTLEPVRRRLLDQAEQDAAAVVERAEREAAARTAAARAECEALRERARSEGAAEAAAAAARLVAAARRDARSVILRARAQEQARTREAVLAAATGLRRHDGYPALLGRLAALARAALGPDAVVTEAAAGGVQAHRGSRRVDLSLPTLVDQDLNALERARDDRDG